MPLEGVDGEGAGVDRDDLGSVVLGVGELLGAGVFVPAEAPEGDDAGEGEDGPATAAEGGLAGADLGVDEAEEGGGDEGQEEE